jgi:hypothetical protein
MKLTVAVMLWLQTVRDKCNWQDDDDDDDDYMHACALTLTQLA